MSEASPTEREQRFRARKNVTFLLLFAIVMFFVALSSAYVVSKGSTLYWSHFTMPRAFWISTAIILASSVPMQLSLVAARRGRVKAIAPWLLVTFVLGLAFSWSQFRGWSDLVERKLNFTAPVMLAEGSDVTITRNDVPLVRQGDQFYLPDDTAHERPLNAEMEDFKNTASSYFWVITVAHWAHLLGGLLVLLVLLIKSLLGRYTAEAHTGIWQGTLYWHFLGGLWVYLLLFLTIVH